MKKLKTLQDLERQKLEIEKQIEILKLKEDILYEDNNLRIIKWENKEVRGLPEGSELATFQEFIDLIDSGKFELEKNKYYFTKHFSKIQWNKEYCLSGLYLDSGLNLNSDETDLTYSDDYGRVVLKKKDLEKEE